MKQGNYSFSTPSRTSKAGAIAAFPRSACFCTRMVSCKTDRDASEVNAEVRVVACAHLTSRPLLLSQGDKLLSKMKS